MKIKHNSMPYIIPWLLALILGVCGITEWGDEASIAMGLQDTGARHQIP